MQQTHRHPVTLVLGGARSGKSRYAQQLATLADTGPHAEKKIVFLATATAVDHTTGAVDAEMHRKIRHHQQDRPAHWLTVEEPLDLPRVIEQGGSSSLLLIDCLTFYTFNLLCETGTNDAQIEGRIAMLESALQAAKCPVVLVSNEVGSGIVPADALSCRYRDLLGELNQRMARLADDVVYLVASLPLPLKSAGFPTFSGGPR